MKTVIGLTDPLSSGTMAAAKSSGSMEKCRFSSNKMKIILNIYPNNSKAWRDSNGDFHRNDGPAVIFWKIGTELFYNHGIMK